MDILEAFLKLDDEVVGQSNITTTRATSGFGKINADLKKFPPNLQAFYNVTDGYRADWETREAMPDGQKIYGRINILPSKSVLHNWKGVVYFDKDPDYEMDKFKIVDFFQDEICVGYFHDKKKQDIMEYYTFQDEPLSLSVNFAGYLELLFMARGYLNWQKALLHLNGEENNGPFVKQFQSYMPQLFPDFKWEEFVTLYERVRIK